MPTHTHWQCKYIQSTPDPDDYLGGEFTVTFSNGSTTAQITIPVTNDMDGADECDEDFNAQISIPEEAAASSVVAGPDNIANVVIKDDERKCSTTAVKCTVSKACVLGGSTFIECINGCLCLCLSWVVAER